MYNNKFIHDNNFWIKRAKYYSIFIIVMYLILYVFATMKINIAVFNLFVIYCFIFCVAKLHQKYRYVIEGEIGLYKPTQDEINKIAILQKIDENELVKLRKWQFNFWFLIVSSIVYYIVITNIYFLSGIVLFFMMIGYDIFIQKKFKRDITKLFWKKRITYYFYLVVPFVFVVDGFIRLFIFAL